MSVNEEPIPTAEPGYEPRQRGLLRRDRFLDAASRAFVEKGFEATSLQDVVAEAGGSLATLYRLFGNKEGLFQAVLQRKFESVFGSMELPPTENKTVEEILNNLGMGVLSMILSAEAIGMHRLMIAEAKRTPRVREIFMDLAPNRAKRYLADYFRRETQAGRLRIADCELAASQYLEMIKGDFYMRQLLGEEIHPTLKERQRIVGNAIGIFLHGVAGEA